MTIQQLEFYQSCAIFLNFRRAAQYHFVSESTLSRQIAALELELNVTLFHRDAKGVRLTEAGALLFRRSVEILNQISEYRRTLCSEGLLRPEPNPYFRITCHISDNIFPHLVELLELLPTDWLGKQYKIDLVREGTAPDAVLRGAAQLGIDLAANLQSFGGAFRRRLFLRMPLKVLVAPDHPLAGHDCLTVGELLAEYHVWSDFLLPDVMKEYVEQRQVDGLEGLLSLRKILSKHLPYVECVRWARKPDHRLLLPHGELDIPEYGKLHAVELTGVPAAATDYMMFWKSGMDRDAELLRFCEMMDAAETYVKKRPSCCRYGR